MIDRVKVGLFILGLNNALLFVGMLSSAFKYAETHGLSLGAIVFFQIGPGYLVQELYSHLQCEYKYKTNVLLILGVAIIANLSYILLPIETLYLTVSLYSINCYLGEIIWIEYISGLSLELFKYWSSGTGLTGLVAAGSHILLAMYIERPFLVFIPFNLALLLVGAWLSYSKSEDWRPQLDCDDPDLELGSATETVNAGTGRWAGAGTGAGYQSRQNNDESSVSTTTSRVHSTRSGVDISRSRLFLASASLWLESLFRYFFNFCIIPLSLSDPTTSTVLYFVGYLGVFLGKTFGNLYQIDRVASYSLVHLYNVALLLIINHLSIVPILICVFISNLINGTCYPQVYKWIIRCPSVVHKEVASKFVCRLNSLSTILGAIAAYLGTMVYHRFYLKNAEQVDTVSQTYSVS